MQGNNKSAQRPPVKGDGTVHERKPRQDANWFGTSQEPQEEYTEQSNQSMPNNERSIEQEKESQSSMSEGKPTLG